MTDTLTALVRRLAAVAPWIGLLGALVWAANIFLLSNSSSIRFGEAGPYHAWLSNLAHAPAFGILALFVFLAFPQSTPRFGFPRAVVVVLITVAYGITDEIHQSFTPGRDASVCDVVTDLCGAVLVAGALVTLERGPAARARFLLVALLGAGASALAAWIATNLPPRFPEHPWL